MNLKETYNKIAKDWYNEVNANHWWENGLNKFISFLKKGDSVLDVGCGPGITAKYFVKHDIKVLGIDFAEKMIKIAKREVPEGEFLIMDLTNIDRVKNSFDGIYLQNVLLHIPKKEVESILIKTITLLKSGGYAYVSVKEKPKDGPKEYVKIDNDYGYTIERFFSLFTKEEIERYFKNVNLKIVFFDIIQTGKTRWIQVIGKKI